MNHIIENIKTIIQEIKQGKIFRISFPRGTMIRETVGGEYRPTIQGENFLVKRADWAGMTSGTTVNGDIFKALDEPLSFTQLPEYRTLWEKYQGKWVEARQNLYEDR